jgi:hypothetical protein
MYSARRRYAGSLSSHIIKQERNAKAHCVVVARVSGVLAWNATSRGRGSDHH